MLKFRAFGYLILFLLLAGIASAATIHGTVYDLSLKKQSNARVEINTSPNQFLVAQNGTYYFNVPNGYYTIKAYMIQKNTVLASVQENITIKQAGDYVLDLILFPEIEEGVEEVDINISDNIAETKNYGMIVVFIILSSIIVISAALFYFKKYSKAKKEKSMEDAKTGQKGESQAEDDGLKQITDIVKKEGGRATQKDIRKQIPLSEAKISLMIAELEHKGIIEKIKKGRGNILILKKK